MRVAVYTDYVYRREDGRVFAERAFAVFLTRLADALGEVVLVGRLHPDTGRSHYALPPGVELVGLPHYGSLARPLEAAPSMLRSLGRFWRALDRVDAAWLLGPYLLSIAFALLAALRGKRVFLGVRQDFPRYVKSRHPGRRRLHLAALALETAFRALARAFPIIVVGPDLARRYAGARRLLAISVSLVRDRDVVSEATARARPYDGELRVLSVGRLETEKNPLLLADILARLRERDARWRLTVCGEGPLAGELLDRCASLGVADAVDLRGYVPIDRGLADLYRDSHALLHVSWTEGLPQILFEALAAGLPVVATDVGGVREAVGDSALLVAPGDADAAAAALRRVASEPELRERLVRAGLALARNHTTEAECRRIAAFMGVDAAAPAEGNAATAPEASAAARGPRAAAGVDAPHG